MQRDLCPSRGCLQSMADREDTLGHSEESMSLPRTRCLRSVSLQSKQDSIWFDLRSRPSV
jgi:hypothetical protein